MKKINLRKFIPTWYSFIPGGLFVKVYKSQKKLNEKIRYLDIESGKKGYSNKRIKIESIIAGGLVELTRGVFGFGFFKNGGLGLGTGFYFLTSYLMDTTISNDKF